MNTLFADIVEALIVGAAYEIYLAGVHASQFRSLTAHRIHDAACHVWALAVKQANDRR